MPSTNYQSKYDEMMTDYVLLLLRVFIPFVLVDSHFSSRNAFKKKVCYAAIFCRLYSSFFMHWHRNLLIMGEQQRSEPPKKLDDDDLLILNDIVGVAIEIYFTIMVVFFSLGLINWKDVFGSYKNLEVHLSAHQTAM